MVKINEYYDTNTKNHQSDSLGLIQITSVEDDYIGVYPFWDYFGEWDCAISVEEFENDYIKITKAQAKKRIESRMKSFFEEVKK